MFVVEHVVAVLAGQFGLVHGLIGLTQQLVGIHLVGLRVKRHANAGRHLQGQFAQHQGLGSGFEQAGQHGHAVGHVWQVYQYGGKLVATHSCKRIALAQDGLHALCQCDQHLVAHLVAVQVIDAFEPVQVDVGHGQHLSPSQGLCHGLAHAVTQQYAVGQIGQRVEMGDVLQLALVLFAGRDV